MSLEKAKELLEELRFSLANPRHGIGKLKVVREIIAELSKQPKTSYCKRHDTYPDDDEPCWQCINAELSKQTEPTKYLDHSHWMFCPMCIVKWRPTPYGPPAPDDYYCPKCSNNDTETLVDLHNKIPRFKEETRKE